nr:unnamed protein product [Spirometra erinaceieuropaei]
MGSPISSLVAELVLQMEKSPSTTINLHFGAGSRLADFQNLLNGIFPDIQFTREEKHAEQLPFLDVLVTRTPNGGLNTTVYRKATNTTQILNYHMSQRDEYENYGIFGTNWQEMDTRTASSAAASARTQGEQTEESRQHWHSLPYIKNVSEAMERIAREFGVGIAYRPTATMHNEIMRVKDRLDVEESPGVVYQIPCRDCPRHYTGQTGRRLNSRIT